MQDPWTIVGVVLLAVFVGAATPVLFQLYTTLRVTRTLLDRLGPKIDGTLTEVRETTRRLNRVGGGLEESVKRAQTLLDAAGDIGQSMKSLHESLKTATAVGSALGPALAAAIRAFTEMRRGEDGEESAVGGEGP
jgi:ABC-type transporter Mla subunit MlaD